MNSGLLSGHDGPLLDRQWQLDVMQSLEDEAP